MNHEELQNSLGAFALDAVDPDEAEIIARHLDVCPRCRAEVTAHRETAALLGNFGAQAPDGIWDRIATEIGGSDGPPAPILDLEPRPPRSGAPGSIGMRRSSRRLRVDAAKLRNGLLATAAAVLVAALAVSVVRLDRELRDVRAAVAAGGRERAVTAVVLAGDHREVRLASTGGGMATDVVIGRDGEAFVITSELPSLPAGRTYQLWGLAGGRVVSLGLLGRAPRLASFRIDAAVTQLMVTAEPEGGVVAPDGPVLVQGDVASA